MITDIIIIGIILITVGGAVFYLIKSKLNGKKCIGCPYANSCKECSCTNKNNESK